MKTSEFELELHTLILKSLDGDISEEEVRQLRNRISSSSNDLKSYLKIISIAGSLKQISRVA